MSIFRSLLNQGPVQEYTFLEYIQGQGQQYINLDYYPTTKTGIEFELLSDGRQNMWDFGSNRGWQLDAYGVFSFYYDGPHWYMTNDYSFNVVNDLRDNRKYNIKFDKSGYYVDGSYLTPKEAFTPTAEFKTPYPMYLFVQNVGTKPTECSTIRVYFFKIFEDGVLMKHLLPAKRNSDNAVGMVDILTNTFYENKGSGEFLYGTL